MGDPFHNLAAAPVATPQPTLRTFTAAELQAREFPPINWTVPGILPEGLTLLCGKSKVGKSWLALDIALAVASGGDALGREVDQGEVLYISLEDHDRRLKRRLDIIAGRIEWPAALVFGTEWPRLDAGGLAGIQQWAENAVNPRLVIVDTLATVRPVSRASDTLYQSDYAALRGLHGLAARGLSIVVVHHLRKAEGEDPFDAVSGSTGLTGAADTTLILSRGSSDGGVTLYGRGRDLEELELAVEFDTTECRWRDLGDPAEAFASETRAAIFAAVRAGQTAPKAVADATGLDHELVKKTMQRMARAGDLEKNGHGSYRLPQDPLSPVSPCPQGGEEGDKGTEGTPPLRPTDPEAWR